MNFHYRSMLIALSLFAIVAGGAQAAPAEGDHGHAVKGQQAIRGAKLFRDNCSGCHGTGGDGRGQLTLDAGFIAPNFTLPKAVAQFPKERMLKAMDGGHQISVTEVIKTPLTREEMDLIADYIREAFMLPSYAADSSVGQQIYARICSVCHGDRGNGASWAQNSLNPSPFDFTSYKARRLSRRHMINTVTYGRDGTAMVGWATQMTREEIAAVVDFVRTTFIFPEMKRDISESGNQVAGIPESGNESPDGHNHGGNFDMGAPFSNGLIGDTVSGKKLFIDNCAPCHGESGGGDGPRAYFIFPTPENLKSTRAKAELNRDHLFSSISVGLNGTVMPAWRTVMNDQQIADVAEYVLNEFIGAGEAPPPNWKPDEHPAGGHGEGHNMAPADQHGQHGAMPTTAGKAHDMGAAGNAKKN